MERASPVPQIEIDKASKNINVIVSTSFGRSSYAVVAVPLEEHDGKSQPVSEVTRQSDDFLEPSGRSAGIARAGGRMLPIRSSSANIQIGRSPSRHIVPLNIPKGYSVYCVVRASDLCNTLKQPTPTFEQKR
ncbi:Uncharacterized protein Fot_13394 [Forsythia ovata]|uniref:Uncharacterized protein n=1 Tax=Forsythia ovata TaxID=205694 RepID=A0ABD1W3T8_9LAMI